MKYTPLIRPLKPGLKISDTGNKARSLIFLNKFGFRIPATYILIAGSYNQYLKEGIPFLEKLREEVSNLPYKSYAIRSSTTCEDSEDFTYAGQFKTLTNITGTDNILKAIQEIWESADCFTDSEYHKRIVKEGNACAVIIQEMVHAKLAGVSFSKNPITNQEEIIIEAVEGPGEDLVQRGVTPLRWRFRNGVITEGNCDYSFIDVIGRIAADTEKLRRLFRYHVDIEWVYNGEQIYYLQFRNITGNKELNIYSSKLAKEMLPGQIKPLVWSVNIPLVNGTWIKLLSEITGYLDIRPEDLAKSFYYRTYFNIAVLGRIFMQFGLSARILEDLLLGRDDTKPSFKPGLRTLRHSFRIMKFIYGKMTFEKRFLNRYALLRQRYDEISERINADFSLDTYQKLYSMMFEEGTKLTYLNIVIPILMQIYNKRLSKRLKKIGIEYDMLDFNADFPELQSLSPLPSIKRIRAEIDLLPESLRSAITSFDILKSYPEAIHIIRYIDMFLKDFGHFSESGNDFSIPKWQENPSQVFNMIMKSESVSGKTGLCRFSELETGGKRPGYGLRRLYMKAGRFKVYREQISSLFIFGHGLFRQLFLKVGSELRKHGVIASEEDIFYLDKKEIDGIIEEIRSGEVRFRHDLINARKDEIAATSDFLLPSVIYGEHAPILEMGRIKNHHGVGSSPGIFTGVTKVIRGTNEFGSVTRGDILVIPFSDVSWTPVLTLAGAIISETGGVLSHCSIIAREMGIPALVSVENACSIGDGLNATVDGSNGILTIHDYE